MERRGVRGAGAAGDAHTAAKSGLRQRPWDPRCRWTSHCWPSQAALGIELLDCTGILKNLNIYLHHIYKSGKETRGNPEHTPHLADQPLGAAEEADTAGRNRIYVAYLNYSECKTGPIYRAETLRVEGAGSRASTRVLARRCPACHLPHLSQRHLCGPAGVLRGERGRSHDARRGEDRAHAQGVCDLPAAGQRLAHALSILILFCRQRLLSHCFPVGERGALEATSMGPAGWGLLMALHQKTWPPSGIGVSPEPQSPA